MGRGGGVAFFLMPQLQRSRLDRKRSPKKIIIIIIGRERGKKKKSNKD